MSLHTAASKKHSGCVSLSFQTRTLTIEDPHDLSITANPSSGVQVGGARGTLCPSGSHAVRPVGRFQAPSGVAARTNNNAQRPTDVANEVTGSRNHTKTACAEAVGNNHRDLQTIREISVQLTEF